MEDGGPDTARAFLVFAIVVQTEIRRDIASSETF